MNYEYCEKKVLHVLYLVVFFTFFSAVRCYAQNQNDEPNLGIIPAPVMAKKHGGDFFLNSYTRLVADNLNDKAANYLKAYLKNNNIQINKQPVQRLTRGKLSANILVLTSSGTKDLPEEGYRLKITPNKITIAGKGAGLFYGVETFLQLLPPGNNGPIKIPCADIEDYPRFAYRGFMLDVSRHFFSIDEVKKIMDKMAAYKLNSFHWHLVDNDGWRIEIKKYPKLTSIGGFRNTAVTAGNRDWFDQSVYGGYYTQEQIREVVKYASDRYITIIPEIEMPAHSKAALMAYPELMCEPATTEIGKRNHELTYCPSEQTFHFLEDVLTEVIDLFPSKYIHIGGDEANKAPWKESAFCQQLIKKMNLKDEDGLQSYFIQREEHFLNSKGRNIIGWDEILEGGLAQNASVMSWRGEQGGIAAARLKHNVIMTPGSNGLYFDYAQSRSDMEPINIGGYSSLEKTYNYDPVPKELDENEKKFIVGVQGNLWTEFVLTPAKLQYMTFPRLFALAEVAWSAVSRKNYNNFATIRLPLHLAMLDRSGFNYRVPTPLGINDTTLTGSKFAFNLAPPLPGAKIYYTLNGKKPGDTDNEYSDTLNFNIPAGEKRELQTLVISPSGRRSVITKVVMTNPDN
ncbi:MAG: family 20 glycosylhydrolase [Bacteroidota bacterium]